MVVINVARLFALASDKYSVSESPINPEICLRSCRRLTALGRIFADVNDGDGEPDDRAGADEKRNGG